MAYVLNDHDRELLQEMLRHVRLSGTPGPGRAPGDLDYLTPEVYVAKPQSASGIPALTVPDQPGVAACDIYQIVDGSLVSITTLSYVYNLSLSPIPQDWIIVQRDKYGKWLVVDFPRVLFGKLDGTLSAGSSATMSIWAGNPLADTTQNVTVYDWYLEAAGSLATGTKVKAEMYSGLWYVTTAECPV
jgi:hypothetical protein